MIKYKKEKYWKYVEEFIKELKTADYWFKNDGNPNPEWKLFKTRNAARNAARNAVGYAARNAVGYTAWNAAWNAADMDAARAAGEAAGDAARDTAWNAAGDTAWNAAGDTTVFARMLCCIDLDVELKHLLHLNARMEVWRKGYGLLCDVDGVLYVYQKP